MRQSMQLFWLLSIIGAVGAWAQPKIDFVRNAAGFTIAGTPYYGIAQGSVFAVAGSALGPEEPVAHNLDDGPLPTSLAGVSVQIAITARPGETFQALLYSVSKERVLAILPSSTPTGDGVVTFTYDGKSVTTPIKVVDFAFGIATVDGKGIGTAIAHFHDEEAKPVSFLNSAHMGEIIVLEGTGLGADPNSDETNWIENPSNIEGAPLEVYFGKIPAEIRYKGRTRRPGWDRIEVVVPEGIGGCYVSVYAKSGSNISNFVTLPVSENLESRNCVEVGFGTPDITELLTREVVNAGWLYLGQFSSTMPAIGPIPASTTTTDSANAGFIRFTPFMFSNFGGRGDPGFGSCVVTTAIGTNVVGPQAVKYLDAGPHMTLTLPNGGSVRLNKESPIPTYSYSSAPPQRPGFIPKEGGTFRFTSDGGEDVGPVNAPIRTNGPFTWTNRGALGEVNRASDVEVRWTGGDEDTYMLIYGASATMTDPPVVTSFNCVEKTSAGKFTIPRDVMSSMVQSASIPGPFAFPTGQLAVVNYRYPVRFEAPGLDVGNISMFFWDGLVMHYK
jgi:uncharacterized protein (TIGR03437 family)